MKIEAENFLPRGKKMIIL